MHHLFILRGPLKWKTDPAFLSETYIRVLVALSVGKAQNIPMYFCKCLTLTSFTSFCCGFLPLDEQNPLVMWPLSTIIMKRIKIQFDLLSLHNAKFNAAEGWLYWFCIRYSMEISYLDTHLVLAVKAPMHLLTSSPLPPPLLSLAELFTKRSAASVSTRNLIFPGCFRQPWSWLQANRNISTFQPWGGTIFRRHNGL